ncbi:Pro-resilin [Frankliniella fusca]|uniref:Pro-resilin n=1 Tax=Frankliniella fusca TaxID=407009 RepID=A0AAE1HBD4_9NEOP|nr:Pro-resilin [Frankliniella fusca]
MEDRESDLRNQPADTAGPTHFCRIKRWFRRFSARSDCNSRFDTQTAWQESDTCSVQDAPRPSALLVALALALLAPSLALPAAHGPHGLLPRPRRQVGAEPQQVADNEAEATDEYPQHEQQDAQDQQQGQEARHYSRRADDNYEDEQDIVYDFSYEVKDPHTGNDFGHRQSRANGLTQGQYRVLLPDGRMQVVDYVSDRDGFRPNIRYEDVGIPVFAGTEHFEQFADGSNHFEQEAGPGASAAPSSPAADGQAQGPSPDEVRRRRRAAPAAPARLAGLRRH